MKMEYYWFLSQGGLANRSKRQMGQYESRKSPWTVMLGSVCALTEIYEVLVVLVGQREQDIQLFCMCDAEKTQNAHPKLQCEMFLWMSGNIKRSKRPKLFHIFGNKSIDK